MKANQNDCFKMLLLSQVAMLHSLNLLLKTAAPDTPFIREQVKEMDKNFTNLTKALQAYVTERDWS